MNSGSHATLRDLSEVGSTLSPLLRGQAALLTARRNPPFLIALGEGAVPAIGENRAACAAAMSSSSWNSSGARARRAR